MYSNIKVNFSDAYEIISKKIVINRMYINMTKNQMDLSENIKQLQDNIINVSSKRLILLNNMNNIFEKQLSEFTEERQIECMNIYQDVTNLDKYDEKTEKCINKCKFLEDEINGLIIRIKALEDTLPKTKLITNYKIKEKKDEIKQNCSLELINNNINIDEELPE